MAVEYHVKRIVWVAECKCDHKEPYRRVEAENPPREVRCPKCGNWLPFNEESSSSPEYRTLLKE